MANPKNKTLTRPSLAILDWGIGGMDFYRLFKSKYPDIGICYLSDSGSIPYGKQTKEQLSQRLDRVVEFLQTQGVTSLVVACNAMSTVLPSWSKAGSPRGFHITGVIEPTISSALGYKAENVGVVGGRRTILSGAYSRPLRKSFPSVMPRIAQPLSALIERGDKGTPVFQETLAKIMGPLKKADLLLLACTHYPAAQESFQRLAPYARMINPSLETFKWVDKNWPMASDNTSDVFYTTGDTEEMRSSSMQVFGVKVGDISRVKI